RRRELARSRATLRRAAGGLGIAGCWDKPGVGAGRVGRGAGRASRAGRFGEGCAAWRVSAVLGGPSGIADKNRCDRSRYPSLRDRNWLRTRSGGAPFPTTASIDHETVIWIQWQESEPIARP